MNPRIKWQNDNDIRRVFAWQTRIGIAPYFGTLPIAYYQQDQCKANDVLCEWADGQNVRYCSKNNTVYRTDGEWITVYRLNQRIKL